METNDFILVEAGLSGSEIINRLRKGNVVRRSCWIDGIYIRITNERGFDENGNAVHEEKDSLYTICTNGYFQHLGYSSQPFRHPRVYSSPGYGAQIASRDGEGITCLFYDDWEDYGFWTREDFNAFTVDNKNTVRDHISSVRQQAIKKWEEEHDK